MDKSIVTLTADVSIERAREAHLFHELSNVSTLGFKRSYEHALTSIQDGAEVADNSQLGETKVSLRPGPKIFTGNPLDLYMNDDAVMGVLHDGEEIGFTRRGDLRVDGNGFLVNGSGYTIAADNEDPIQVPLNQTISISDEGVVYALDPQQEVAEQVEIGRIMLRDASNVELTKKENGLFRAVGFPPGDFEPGPEPVSISTGIVEGSTVSAMEAMVEIMDHMRSFEMKIKLIKDFDELGESNSTLMRMA